LICATTSSDDLAANAKLPFGVIAMPAGLPGSGIVCSIKFVFRLITQTEFAMRLVT
jgi:hypothetical protein